MELVLQGQILDPKFARALMERSDLALGPVLLLDRVQKGLRLTAAQARELRELKLIEGRAPKYFISAKVADATGQKACYIHNRGMDDQYYKQLVLDYIKKHGMPTRSDLDELLLPKLPNALTAIQKANKIRNLLQNMRKSELVHPVGPRASAAWRLSK